MTDYEEGRYYGWNGGECPVHPKTKVAAWFADGEMVEALAEVLYWSGSEICNIPIVFHVVKKHIEPVEPMEIWVLRDNRSDTIMSPPVFMSRQAAQAFLGHLGRDISIVKFVEVV